MDALNELAKSLDNDASFATNIHNQIALKAHITYVDGQLAFKRKPTNHLHPNRGRYIIRAQG